MKIYENKKFKIFRKVGRLCGAGAKNLVKVLAESPIILGGLESGTSVITNDVETILNELNLGICDFAITQFYDLIYGKHATNPLTGDEAYNWDLKFITHEQGTVAPQIYKKTSSDTIKKFQDMADKNPKGWHGTLSQIISWTPYDILPAFDDFDPPAKVTDDQFRTDLPLLMLYLDKHKPTPAAQSLLTLSYFKICIIFIFFKLYICF